MFVAVSFLALTNAGIEGQALPQGKRALTITASARICSERS
nr:hypothetical protein [uncultured Desulfobacter sp.]